MDEKGEEVQKIKRHYQENLNPIDYHRFILGGPDDEEMREYIVTSLTALYKLVKSERFKGTRLLEIGSGPTVHNVASAATYFPEIVQSDFVDTNCEELKKWLRGESELDWSPFLKVVAKIEGIEEEWSRHRSSTTLWPTSQTYPLAGFSSADDTAIMSVSMNKDMAVLKLQRAASLLERCFNRSDSTSGLRKIEERIRKSVKSVVHCDLLTDEVVPKEVAFKYDLIVTSLTLEAVALDFENYVTILKRLNRLLRPGGGLAMIGFLNGGKWTTGTGEFHHLKISQEEVDKALELAGFKDRDWIRLPKRQEITDYEYDAYFYVASEKI